MISMLYKSLVSRVRFSPAIRISRAWFAVGACGLAALLGQALPATGASRFWDGSVNGNFSNAGNWVGGIAPAAGDDLVFQAGIPRLLVTNDFSPNRAFNTLLFQGSNYFVRG